MAEREPHVADLLAALYERLPPEARALAAELEVGIQRQTASLEREYERMKRAAFEYRSERDILRLVAGVADSAGADASTAAEFVAAAVEAIEQMPRVEHGCVVLFDDTGRPSVLETVRMDDGDRTMLDEQISEGIVARVRETSREIYIEKATEDRMFGGLASVRALNIQTVLCCPIPGIAGGSPRGVLYVENRHKPGAFAKAWREAVRLLASQMAQQIALLERVRAPAGDPTQPYRRGRRYAEIVGRSELTARLLADLDRIVAMRHPPTALIVGETGVGKEMVAWALHRYGPRRDGPFVAVNAAALAPTLVESELFGARRGAFTDARERPGLFREADGGILFLDEIGDLPPEIQAKLLRVLDDGRVRPLGGGEVKVDTWVVAATNVDLEQAIEEGRFRRDLYYRLTESLVYVSPLRERPDDVEALAVHFAAAAAERRGVRPPVLSPDLLIALRSRAWTGNVRELRATIEALVGNARSAVLTIDDLRAQGSDPLPPAAASPDAETWDAVTQQFHDRYLRLALQRWGPSPQRVAERLGIHRTYLYKLMRRHGIEPARSRRGAGSRR